MKIKKVQSIFRKLYKRYNIRLSDPITVIIGINDLRIFPVFNSTFQLY